MYGERMLWHCDMRWSHNCPFGRILASMTDAQIKKGDRVRITWSGREGTLTALYQHRLAGYRILLDGETEDWGFNRNELERIESEADR
jgi:hypothetical protein